MIHWIPNVEVHGHPYGDVWGSDLVGVSLAKTRENKYAFLKIQLICFSLFLFPNKYGSGQRLNHEDKEDHELLLLEGGISLSLVFCAVFKYQSTVESG
jgi:hypothetical protein